MRDYAPAQWELSRQYAVARGVRPIPWARLAHVELGETIETVRFFLRLLIQTAQAWGTNWIMPNYEKEAETISPFQVQKVLNQLSVELGWTGNTVWSTQGWLPNGVDFKPISADPVLLQIFPADMQQIFPGDTRHDPTYVANICGDCVWHARELGFTYVGLTYQTYGDMIPVDFDCESWQHSTFPGNRVHEHGWSKWYV